jgi:uncharacterized membrane protein YqgA involved in biofilm formation
MLDGLEKFLRTIYGYISNTVILTFPLLNTVLIVMAGCFGSMLYHKARPAHKDVLLKALGIAAIIMGFSQFWDGFFTLDIGQFETKGTMLVLFALLLGYVLGDALALDRYIGRLGLWLNRLFAKKPDPAAKSGTAAGKAAKKSATPELAKAEDRSLSEGFILACVFCAFSAPTFRSAIEFQTAEDAAPLLVKLGFDIAVIFTLSIIYGTGVTFVAAPVLAVEGIFLLSYTLFTSFLTPDLINQLCLIGAVMLITAGIRLGLGQKSRAANFIPAYLIPVVWALITLVVDAFMKSE